MQKHHALIFFMLICATYMQTTMAQTVSMVTVNAAQGRVSWIAGGMQWNAVVEKDAYFGGDTIPVISVDVPTGNESPLPAAPNCYYRGTLSDTNWQPIAQTHAFVNLCDNDPHYFTGFISDPNNVYVIDEDPTAPGSLTMVVDDPTTPLTTPNETRAGNNGGKGKLLSPDNLEPRNSTPGKYPSVEIVVEPSFIATFGNPGYIHRIAGTLAFANFIYQQSGMKELTLISINVLSEELNQNGGIGAIRHQMQNLRRSTVQNNSGDISILMVGGDIDSTYTWGWAIDANACKLQIAVDQGDDINTIEVGRSSAFFTDLPSLIQRGWIFAHEIGHVIGAEHHINGDPLMDGWFQSIASLAGYVAGCDAKTQIFASCEYDEKSGKETDFYTCD